MFELYKFNMAIRFMLSYSQESSMISQTNYKKIKHVIISIAPDLYWKSFNLGLCVFFSHNKSFKSYFFIFHLHFVFIPLCVCMCWMVSWLLRWYESSNTHTSFAGAVCYYCYCCVDCGLLMDNSYNFPTFFAEEFRCRFFTLFYFDDFLFSTLSFGYNKI